MTVREVAGPTPRQLVQGLLGLALAGALIYWGLPWIGSTTWTEILDALDQVGAGTAIALTVLLVLGLWCYTFTLTGSLPGLSHTRALTVNVAGSAVSKMVPGGGAAGVAVSYLMCRTWGFSRRSISTSVAVTGVVNLLARLALPVVGVLVLLTAPQELPPQVVRGAVAGAAIGTALIALFVALLVSDEAARTVGQGLTRLLSPLSRRLRARAGLGIDELVQDLRARTRTVVRAGGVRMTFGLVGLLGLFFVLYWQCAEAVGVDLPLAQLFAAYAVRQILATVALTPGGLGLTEAGTAAVLIAWGADPVASAATAVLFAIYVTLLEIPLGAMGWLAWWTGPRTFEPDQPTAANRT